LQPYGANAKHARRGGSEFSGTASAADSDNGDELGGGGGDGEVDEQLQRESITWAKKTLGYGVGLCRLNQVDP
jgi:hypothetical protein